MKAVTHFARELIRQLKGRARKHYRQALRATIVVAASASAIALSSNAQAAGRVFYDGFESGNTNLWDQDGTRIKCTVVSSGIDGTVPRGGSKMAQCNWNGAISNGEDNAFSVLRLNSWSFSNEFLIRFWVRSDKDVDGNPGAKFFRWGDFNNAVGGDMSTLVVLYGDSVTAAVHGASGELLPTFTGPSVFDNRWHKIELYVKQAASSGVVKLWADGALLRTWTGDTRQYTGKWFLTVMSNWENNPGWEHDASNHLYWDEFEIYSDTGTGATGSLADASITSGTTSPPATASAPTAPNGLVIN